MVAYSDFTRTPVVGDVFSNLMVDKYFATYEVIAVNASSTTATCKVLSKVNISGKSESVNLLKNSVTVNRQAGETYGDMVNLGYALGLEEGKEYTVKYKFNGADIVATAKYEAVAEGTIEGATFALCQSISAEGQTMKMPMLLGVQDYNASLEDYQAAALDYGFLYIVDKHQITGDAIYTADENNSSAYVRALQSANAQNAVNVEIYAIGQFTEIVADKAIADEEGNNIVATYAKQNGNYPSMTVGNSRTLTAIQLTNEDLNTLSGASYWGKTYYAAGGNSVLNKPAGTSGFFLEILRGGVGTTVHKFIATLDTTGKSIAPNIYIRQKIEDEWTSWEQVTTADGSYPTLQAGRLVTQKKITATSAALAGWHKFAEVQYSTAQYNYTYSAIVLVNGVNSSQYAETQKTVSESGIIEIDFYKENVANPIQIAVSVLSGNVNADELCAVLDAANNKIALYTYLNQYQATAWSLLSEEQTYNYAKLVFDSEYYGSTAPDGAIYAVIRNNAANATNATNAANAVNADGIKQADTRTTDELPDFYYKKAQAGQNFVVEFKYAWVIGLSGYAEYCQLQTYAKWTDHTGGNITQIAVMDTNYFIRASTGSTGWGPWRLLSNDDLPTTTYTTPPTGANANGTVLAILSEDPGTYQPGVLYLW